MSEMEDLAKQNPEAIQRLSNDFGKAVLRGGVRILATYRSSESPIYMNQNKFFHSRFRTRAFCALNSTKLRA